MPTSATRRSYFSTYKKYTGYTIFNIPTITCLLIRWWDTRFFPYYFYNQNKGARTCKLYNLLAFYSHNQRTRCYKRDMYVRGNAYAVSPFCLSVTMFLQYSNIQVWKYLRTFTQIPTVLTIYSNDDHQTSHYSLVHTNNYSFNMRSSHEWDRILIILSERKNFVVMSQLNKNQIFSQMKRKIKIFGLSRKQNNLQKCNLKTHFFKSPVNDASIE